jgi:dihydroorotate dehydrogenase electron transfer subunit
LKGSNLSEVIGVRSFGNCVELGLKVTASFSAEPGQFLHVLCTAPGLILRRPYSLYGVSGGVASLLVRRAGAGSEWLCKLKAGDSIDFLGPLGRGFAINGKGRQALVAGGTGIAPLRFLAARMRAMGSEPVLFWGVDREEEFRGLAGLLERDLETRIATMDGSAGYRGSALELFAQARGEHFEGIYACGPRGMLVGLAESIGIDVLSRLQVSMEERMACGVGACRGCVVPAALPGGGYVTACKDGPVFGGGELDWERIKD